MERPRLLRFLDGERVTHVRNAQRVIHYRKDLGGFDSPVSMGPDKSFPDIHMVLTTAQQGNTVEQMTIP